MILLIYKFINLTLKPIELIHFLNKSTRINKLNITKVAEKLILRMTLNTLELLGLGKSHYGY